MTPNRIGPGNRFVRAFTRAEARARLCAVAREVGGTPRQCEIPHVRAIIGALGCRTLSGAVAAVGLTPNTSGPGARRPLPPIWAEDVPAPVVDGCGIDLAAERAASRERVRKAREAEPVHVRVESYIERSHAFRVRLRQECWDDFVEPVNLAEAGRRGKRRTA